MSDNKNNNADIIQLNGWIANPDTFPWNEAPKDGIKDAQALLDYMKTLTFESTPSLEDAMEFLEYATDNHPYTANALFKYSVMRQPGGIGPFMKRCPLAPTTNRKDWMARVNGLLMRYSMPERYLTLDALYAAPHEPNRVEAHYINTAVELREYDVNDPYDADKLFALYNLQSTLDFAEWLLTSDDADMLSKLVGDEADMDDPRDAYLHESKLIARCEANSPGGRIDARTQKRLDKIHVNAELAKRKLASM